MLLKLIFAANSTCKQSKFPNSANLKIDSVEAELKRALNSQHRGCKPAPKCGKGRAWGKGSNELVSHDDTLLIMDL